MRFYQPILFWVSFSVTRTVVPILLGRSADHSAPGQAPTILVFFNEKGSPLATFVPEQSSPVQGSGLWLTAQHAWPAGRRGPDATFSGVEWERLTLCVNLQWDTLPRFSTLCETSSGHFSLGVHLHQLVWKLEPGTFDKSLATSWLQVVTYYCCCLFMKLEVKAPCLRYKLGKTPHKAPVLDRISHRQFPTEMPVIRSHVESGVAMESICF